jgi:site-specific recombinase XerD
MADTIRNRLLLGLGYGAGLRAGEVLRLKVKHIDSAQMIIQVQQSKGRKDRLVMLSPETLALLREWWKIRPKHADAGVPVEERLLIPGRRKGTALSTHQLNNIFHKVRKAAGIKKAVNVHSLRHSFATHLYDRGVDIRTIQALLGHDKLETTARYARVATGLISAVESPLDRLSGKRPEKKDKGPAK